MYIKSKMRERYMSTTNHLSLIVNIHSACSFISIYVRTSKNHRIKSIKRNWYQHKEARSQDKIHHHHSPNEEITYLAIKAYFPAQRPQPHHSYMRPENHPRRQPRHRDQKELARGHPSYSTM